MVTVGKKTVDALDAYVIFGNLSVYAMKCFLVLFTDVIKFEQSNVELDKIAFFSIKWAIF